MMPYTRETIVSALHALLHTQPAPVLRGEVLTERMLPAGLLILRDGERVHELVPGLIVANCPEGR